jgi:hypothetical protein
MNEGIEEGLADTTGTETPPQQPLAAEGGKRTPAWMVAFVMLAAWAVPGLGHALLRRWVRAVGFFVAVGGLATVGYLMRGEVFGAHAHESFGTLGFLADSASGMFYFLAHFIETAGADVSRATGNYGTRFVAAAGLVNLIGIIDAVETAVGRRG